mmetsp:Transcript_44696/g.107822  ORF Transcript_44696/g.107822 Transcript_44696/m.107822 type:complete len:131 (+) Transcript_44696:607-999(+)
MNTSKVYFEYIFFLHHKSDSYFIPRKTKTKTQPRSISFTLSTTSHRTGTVTICKTSADQLHEESSKTNQSPEEQNITITTRIFTVVNLLTILEIPIVFVSRELISILLTNPFHPFIHPFSLRSILLLLLL